MNIDRRMFLKFGSGAVLMSVAAFNFGCSMKSLVDEDKKVALIYATRYGSTKDTAQWIAKGLDRSVDLLNIEDIDLKETEKSYDLFILGSGIWVDGVHKKMLSLLKLNYFHDKVMASFIVCGTTDSSVQGKKRIEQYFTKFHSSLSIKPALNQHFGGRMIIDKLNKRDRVMLENFYKNVIKVDFVDWDRTEPEKALAFGKKGHKFIFDKYKS